MAEATEREWFLDDEGTEVLVANFTEEGIILDVFRGGLHTGTAGMMADEWAEWAERTGPQ